MAAALAWLVSERPLFADAPENLVQRGGDLAPEPAPAPDEPRLASGVPRRPQPELAPGKRRTPPDYDGRPEEPDAGANAGTWALRVLFFPAYLVSEYLVRRPLGWATILAERSNLLNALVDFFTFGPNRNAALFPTALLDFGFKPSVGLYFSWDDALASGNELSLHAATWGPRWLRLSIDDRYEFAPGSRVGVGLHGWRRPDWLFHGFGPRSRSDDLGRYSRTDLSGELRLDVQLPRTSFFSVHAGVHSSRFEDARCCDDRGVGQLVELGAYPLPPGFDRGIQLYRQGLELAFDSRRPRPESASGFRVVARAEQNLRLGGSGPDQWLRYGGTVGGFLDVSGHDRVVGLSLSAAFAKPLGSDTAIPFTEQILLGGNAPLAGFLEGRLIDRSALVGKLAYTWPVWVLFDGSLNLEAGNVFGEHLSGFSPELARLSISLGVRAHGRRDRPFEALIGLGTAPLDEGGRIESLRLVFGANNGF